MDLMANEYLRQMAVQEKRFDAMYREAGAKFGLPDCSMWVLYFFISSGEPITQQDLIGKMMFPKQTINSAVMKLAGDGFVKLFTTPGEGNRKTIALTEAGINLANNTVRRLLRAELKAFKKMGKERMEQFIQLYSELFSAMREEFIKEGFCKQQFSVGKKCPT